MRFQIIIHDDVRKKIKKIPKNYQETIISKISALSEFPHEEFLKISENTENGI